MDRRALAPGAVLFAGTFLGALLGYGFFVVVGHGMTSDELGAVGSLVNLSTIVSVPALGLQLVTARAVAGRRGGTGGLLGAAALVGGIPALALALLSPVLAPALHLDGVLPVLALAAAAIPMTVTYAGLGVAQGHERFALLGGLALATGAAKIAAGLLGVGLGQGVLGVVGWFCAGWFLLGAAVLPLVRGRGGAPAVARAREAVIGSLPTAGLLVLSSLDLLLARHHLSGAASGVYTVGSLFEKVAFWGPQFLATMAYPRLSRPDERDAALRSALGATAAVGAIGVVVAAVLGGPLVRVVGGARYVGVLGPDAWVFTLVGVLLALVQVLVYADLAVHGHRVGVTVWATAALVVAAVAWRHGSAHEIVTTVAVVVAVGTALAAALTRRGAAAGRPSPDDGVAL